MNSQPFHDGELAVQRRLGVDDQVGPMAARFIRSAMPDQHRSFFEQLPFIVLGALDGHGRPWATAVFGGPGIAMSPDPGRLDLSGKPLFSDVLDIALNPGAKVGALGIELATRRRNRLNAVVVDGASTLNLRVEQSYGNCPQYIHKRSLAPVAVSVAASVVAPDSCSADAPLQATLSRSARQLIEGADTFFIASRARDIDGDHRNGVDVSHRGGKPGFVRVEDEATLVFPDFKGNRFFNTLGNIEQDARVGLWFPDFVTGDSVFLTGRAEVEWESDAVAAFAGAERLVRVRIGAVLFAAVALPMRAHGRSEPSPTLGPTGTW